MLTPIEMLLIGYVAGWATFGVPLLLRTRTTNREREQAGVDKADRLARFDAHAAWASTASLEELNQYSAEADARWRARGL